MLFISEYDILANLVGFPPEHESWSETAVSSTHCMLLCNGPTLFTRVSSASLLFYTFDILHTGCHERLTLLFNCTVNVLMTLKTGPTEEVRHALKSVLFIVFCCHVRLLTLRTLWWQFNDYGATCYQWWNKYSDSTLVNTTLKNATFQVKVLHEESYFSI